MLTFRFFKPDKDDPKNDDKLFLKKLFKVNYNHYVQNKFSFDLKKYKCIPI